jgi:hypothetical protein
MQLLRTIRRNPARLRADARFRSRRQPRRWTRAIAAAQAGRDGYRAAAPDAVLRRARGVGGMARRGRFAKGRPHGIRTEIGLAPEGSGPLAARRQASLRKNVPFAGTAGQPPQQANTRPSAGLQNDFSSDEPESACKPRVFLEAADDRRTASPESVQRDAEEQGDCRNEKHLQMQAFPKAADGFRTHDLLHGKQSMGLSWARKMPANERLPTG